MNGGRRQEPIFFRVAVSRMRSRSRSVSLLRLPIGT